MLSVANPETSIFVKVIIWNIQVSPVDEQGYEIERRRQTIDGTLFSKLLP